MQFKNSKCFLRKMNSNGKYYLLIYEISCTNDDNFNMYFGLLMEVDG